MQIWEALNKACICCCGSKQNDCFKRGAINFIVIQESVDKEWRLFHLIRDIL